jgi:1-acyl-sn-glycerol-3-phosphate acyltransferase
MPTRYPFPWRIALVLFWAALRSQQRAFQVDARTCSERLSPPLKTINPQNIPTRGPALLVTNHYARSGFRAWWIALAISAVVPPEIHWMMTDAWAFLGPLAPLSHWVFVRVARVYGFTTTPPMPPQPRDASARALAVRRVLEVARASGAVIALAPEGRDQPGGVLGPFPPGAGRFIEQIARHCQPIIPVGVYEDGESLCLCFGPPLLLDVGPGSSSLRRDQMIGRQVSEAIAGQLPPHLRTGAASEHRNRGEPL